VQTKVDNTLCVCVCVCVCVQVGQEISDKRTMHACHKYKVEQNYNIKIASKFFNRHLC